MRIVHVNLFDALGGAATTAWTLLNHMSKQGHDVHIFAHRKTTEDPRVIPIPFLSTTWQQRLLAEQARQGLFDVYSAALLQVLQHPLFEEADIVHLHCINGGYFSVLLLPFLTAKPTVWTLHDPLAFTAGCYNTEDCQGWQQEWCIKCPCDEQNSPSKPQRQLMQLLKATIYKMADFTTVCPSQWLQGQVKASILGNHDVRLIPYGIDLDLFCPGDKQAIRSKLGLPQEGKILMFAAHGGLTDGRKGGRFLLEGLQKIHANYPDLVLLTIGTVDSSLTWQLPVKHIDLPFINDQAKMADYYRAADIFVAPSLAENVGLTIIEASACGTPVVAFATGGIPEVLTHQANGYLAARRSSDELARGICYFFDNEEVRRQVGSAARRNVLARYGEQRMVDDYTALYEEIQRTKGWTVPDKVVVARPKDLTHFITAAKSVGGWEQVWSEFWQVYKSYAPRESQGRNIFVDQFYTACLQEVHVLADRKILWKIIEDWLVYRYLPMRSGDLPSLEGQALLDFSCMLRQKIHDYIVQTPLSQMKNITTKQETAIINVWWHVFLNYFSRLNLQENHQHSLGGKNLDYVSEVAGKNNYKKLLLASLYEPFHGEKFELDIISLWQERKLPTCYKVILSFWLTNVPYYSIGEEQRQRLLRVGQQLPKIKVPPLFFDSMVNHISNSFWVASYAGGNHVTALTAFGDFIASHMASFFPQYSSCKEREPLPGDKLRIGYLSRCFYNQSVSYYMVNRVLHHDKNKFEVYTFALGDRNDEMTQLFAQHSEHFQTFTNLANSKPIVQSIIDSQLDILIYTEIGMDPITYMLAGMQLAPIQCAMVGHGTTTGLPTIQYYLSGDFEPPEAQCHYREQLIQLPNLGAAQYPPPLGSSMRSTRQEWNIPEDAILFVSCANGIKHTPERDQVLVEILKRIPTACIALKPHSAYDTGNKLEARIRAVARGAGVENRLFIVPPLKQVGPLLSIADIQLDTYPYGGWTTNMEALYIGLPIVTQEGDMARSRWGAAMLRALGIEEGIATSTEGYIQWAVTFAAQPALRQQVKEKIMKYGKQILFNGAVAQENYEKTLLKIIGKNKE